MGHWKALKMKESKMVNNKNINLLAHIYVNKFIRGISVNLCLQNTGECIDMFLSLNTENHLSYISTKNKDFPLTIELILKSLVTKLFRSTHSGVKRTLFIQKCAKKA